MTSGPLLSLRKRFAAQPPPADCGETERLLAVELRELRERIAKTLSGTRACTSCAQGEPPPVGRWAGGRCCAHDIGTLFSDHDLAALRAGGVRAEDLWGPCTPGAGCAFRTESGCALAAPYRPNACASYVCDDLAQELRILGRDQEMTRLAAELESAVSRFRTARVVRQLERELDGLL